MRSDDTERVHQIQREFEDDVQALQDDFKAMYDAWGAYFTINGSGWEATKLAELRAQGRHAYSFNITAPKTDTLAGSIVADMPDSDWTPVEGARTGTSEGVRHSYYSDKELCNWDQTMIEVIRDGLVHIGWLGMVETKKYSPRGNLGIERILPGFLVPSSLWKTNDDLDMKSASRIGYFTAEGMAHKYKKKSDEIGRAIQDQKKMGRDSTPTNAATLRQQFAGKVGAEYMVIEYHWLEMLQRKRLIGKQMDGNIWIPFPIECQDRDACDAFGRANNIDMATAYPDDYEDSIHHVTTICPDLQSNLLLEDGKSKIQTKSLPFRHFTVSRYNGRNKGIVSEMLDAQRTLDERLTMENEAIATSTGGATLYNEELFTDPDERQDFTKKKNKYGQAIFARLDDVQKVSEPIHPNTNLGDVNRQIGMLFDQILPLVSRVSDSMSAVSDTSKSGILFEREYQVNRIGNMLMDKGVKQLINNLGEAYFYQWQITYQGQPREITKKDGKGSITLNERVPMGVDGEGQIQYGIKNAVEYVPRCRVIVTETQRSGTQQIYRRNVINSLLEQLMKNPEQNMAQIQVLFTEMVQSMDFSDKTKGAVEAASALDAMRVQMSIMTDLSSMKAKMGENTVSILRMEEMAKQLMAQMEQTGAAPGGAPGGAGGGIEEQIMAPNQMTQTPPGGAGGARELPQRPNTGQPGALPPPPSRNVDLAEGNALPESG